MGPFLSKKWVVGPRTVSPTVRASVILKVFSSLPLARSCSSFTARQCRLEETSGYYYRRKRMRKGPFPDSSQSLIVPTLQILVAHHHFDLLRLDRFFRQQFSTAYRVVMVRPGLLGTGAIAPIQHAPHGARALKVPPHAEGDLSIT